MEVLIPLEQPKKKKIVSNVTLLVQMQGKVETPSLHVKNAFKQSLNDFDVNHVKTKENDEREREREREGNLVV